MKSKVKKYILLILFLAAIIFLIFNSNGFLKYNRISTEVEQLKVRIETIKQDRKALQKEIHLIKTDLRMLEKIAREKFNMKLPNEKAIEIQEK